MQGYCSVHLVWHIVRARVCEKYVSLSFDLSYWSEQCDWLRILRSTFQCNFVLLTKDHLSLRPYFMANGVVFQDRFYCSRQMRTFWVCFVVSISTKYDKCKFVTYIQTVCIRLWRYWVENDTPRLLSFLNVLCGRWHQNLDTLRTYFFYCIRRYILNLAHQHCEQNSTVDWKKREI